MARIHHTAICSRDIDASLRFWRDGLGFEVLMDFPFEGDWPTLFGASASKLRAIFLGDPASPDDGILELVQFDGAAPQEPSPAPTSAPGSGFFLVSIAADLEATLARLEELGVLGEHRLVEVANTKLAVVADPDGILVEIMDTKAVENLGRITGR